MSKRIIRSAKELSAEQKKRLTDVLSDVTFEVDENVIGGLMLIDGDKVIDSSAAAGLKKIFDKAEEAVHKKRGIAVKDIPDLIKSKMSEMLSREPDVNSCGKVISAADGVLTIEGLSDCQYGELVLVGRMGYALAMNLEADSIGAILLGGDDDIGYGDLAFTTGRIIEVPVGEELLGRVVDPLGHALDGKAAIYTELHRRIECEAPRIIDRVPVTEPLSTGILAIDSMVPIGKGQRELIIGDRQTGKSSIAIDTIINQRGKNVYCVYVAIGQRASAVSSLITTLSENGAMDYTTVILSTASDSAPLQYIAPYTGAAVAEEFMAEGKDVLIVYDDLTKHAVSYRAISLLLKRPAGREAYPGDIFYLHSKLLERAAKLSDKLGGGSITALPIIETLAGDISSYIPTNVISITDGQIYLESELFKAGQRPAINVGLSVSRVGGAAQSKLMRKLSAQLRLDIAHYRELAIFAQFGSSLDESTRYILEDGAKKVEALKQAEHCPIRTVDEELYLFAIVKGFLKNIDSKLVRQFLEEFSRYAHSACPEVIKEISETGNLSPENEQILLNKANEFLSRFLSVE